MRIRIPGYFSLKLLFNDPALQSLIHVPAMPQAHHCVSFGSLSPSVIDRALASLWPRYIGFLGAKALKILSKNNTHRISHLLCHKVGA